jgi:hypothetical protein
MRIRASIDSVRDPIRLVGTNLEQFPLEWVHMQDNFSNAPE